MDYFILNLLSYKKTTKSGQNIVSNLLQALDSTQCREAFILSYSLFKEIFQTISQESTAQSGNSGRKQISVWVAKVTGICGQNAEKETDIEKEHQESG